MNTCDICGKPIPPKKRLCEECEKGLNITEAEPEKEKEEEEADEDVFDEDE